MSMTAYSSYSFVFSLEFSRLMGRKANKHKCTTKSISKDHSPVGQLAKNRKQIQEYLSKCQTLQSEKKELQKATEKVLAKII
jgi:hypothetical protein